MTKPKGLREFGSIWRKLVLVADVVVPQLAHKLSDGDSVGVVAHKSKHKDAIFAEVLMYEGLGHLVVPIGDQLVHQLEVLLDVALVAAPWHDPQQPHEGVEKQH